MSRTSKLSTSPLYTLVILHCGSVENFADKMGMTRQGASKKISNLKKWTIEDIEKARLILGINNASEFARIFFEQ